MKSKSQKKQTARKSGEPVSYPQTTFSCRMNDERIEDIKELFKEVADEVNSLRKYIEEFSDRVRFLEMEVNRLRSDRNL